MYGGRVNWIENGFSVFIQLTLSVDELVMNRWCVFRCVRVRGGGGDCVWQGLGATGALCELVFQSVFVLGYIFLWGWNIGRNVGIHNMRV